MASAGLSTGVSVSLSLPVSLTLSFRLGACFCPGSGPFLTTPPDSASMTFSLTCLYISLSLAADLLLRYFGSAAVSLSFSLSLCLCGFSDSVSLWLRVSVWGPRSDSIGPPLPKGVPGGSRFCLCSSFGLPHPNPAPIPHSSPRPLGPARLCFLRLSAPPRPVWGLRRPSPPFVCLVFPPPLSLGQSLDLFVSPCLGGWRCRPIP